MSLFQELRKISITLIHCIVSMQVVLACEGKGEFLREYELDESDNMQFIHEFIR